MKKIEAATLEEAYRIACDTFGCSMTELKYEIVQYPSQGFLGLFAKPAIIVASAEERKTNDRSLLQPAAPEVEAVSQKVEPTPETSGERDVSSDERAEERENGSHEKIIERFFDEEKRTEASEESAVDESVLAKEIEEKILELMEVSCFDIDVVEVDVIDDTAYIFLDGEDAALLIGKEGYRYNALSYLLFNWIHGNYRLFIKLEIAQFLSSQQEMIRHYIQPVIEHVRQEGWGRTRPLDGILVQIALEQLREEFPDKYVAIKRQRDGGRYVLINEFNNRRR
ncbi:Jag N-terminal domain-containing protein [Nitratifractor sp.]|uniref:Jag N-terminal domain-containing protein n=1 Tax=Nitratifractor sp. TaxID=2268144 RepID=UPI0025F48810|nr:Jag N-terminal domain-containing protein [Nitratifractor sp.]